MARQIETSIAIAAPPGRVWSILTDFDRFADWNPFIPAISGPLQPGARLSVRIVPPGKGSMAFKPTVLGVLVGLLAAALKATEAGFVAMNQALKARAEQAT